MIRPSARPNPALRRLGFGPRDRVVLVHADDVGMCQATLPAIAELIALGLLTSGSVMVPCPWFPAVAAWSRGHPEADVGVHLTLMSEWEGYRWAPISTRDPGTGLIDGEGYLHRSRERLVGVDRRAARLEMDAQVRRAQEAGMTISHLDAHMYVAVEERLLEHYPGAALSCGVPALIVRDLFAYGPEARRRIADWEDRGMPVFDHLSVAAAGSRDEAIEVAERELDRLPEGLCCILVHPACETPELRAIAPDWRARVADYEAFGSEALLHHVKDRGIHLIGFRDLAIGAGR
jgi:predicted glycoside hydrolase/deacetylase ChbG (UPF0249 family)